MSRRTKPDPCRTTCPNCTTLRIPPSARIANTFLTHMPKNLRILENPQEIPPEGRSWHVLARIRSCKGGIRNSAQDSPDPVVNPAGLHAVLAPPFPPTLVRAGMMHLQRVLLEVARLEFASAGLSQPVPGGQTDDCCRPRQASHLPGNGILSHAEIQSGSALAPQTIVWAPGRLATDCGPN